MNGVVLYVFSGIHLGAKIALSEGTWEIGSDDRCDLILEGLAPHHVLLEVVTEPNIGVFASPKEGILFLNGEQHERCELPQGEAWYLGETCFAWNTSDAEQKILLPELKPVKAENTPLEEVSEDAKSFQETVGSEKTDDEPVIGDREESQQAPAQDIRELHLDEPEPPKKSGFAVWSKALLCRIKRPIPMIVLAMLLSALSLVTTTGPKRDEYPAMVTDILEKQGITSCSVRLRSPGVEVRGSVAHSEDRSRLEKAVQFLPFPVYLELMVDADVIRAIENTLRIRGFFPLVSVQRNNGATNYMVSAYMRDPLVEADIFSALDSDLPYIRTSRHIVYEKDVNPILSTRLAQEGFSDIRAVYMPGRIVLRGTGTPETDVRLLRLQAELTSRFRVPLFGERQIEALSHSVKPGPEEGASLQKLSIPEKSPKPKEQTPNPTAQPVKPVQDPLGGIELTGVYSAPLPFVTTKDGQRLFVGSVLPNGAVLENISTNALMLRMGNAIISYQLRGNNE